MKLRLPILAFVLASIGIASRPEINASVGPAFKVHGRLSVYCGNPACRIWVVGTKRILGVAESEPPEDSFMPATLKGLLTTENLVFGDFTVVPLTKDEDGVMRIVRVVAAENLVITDWHLNFVRRVKGKIEIAADEPAEPPISILLKR